MNPSTAVLGHCPDSHGQRKHVRLKLLLKLWIPHRQGVHCGTREKRLESTVTGLDGNLNKAQMLCHCLSLTSSSPELKAGSSNYLQLDILLSRQKKVMKFTVIFLLVKLSKVPNLWGNLLKCPLYLWGNLICINNRSFTLKFSKSSTTGQSWQMVFAPCF